MMEKIVDEKLAANWHGRRRIGAKLKPEVYKSAVVEQGCLDMGGSDNYVVDLRDNVILILFPLPPGVVVTVGSVLMLIYTTAADPPEPRSWLVTGYVFTTPGQLPSATSASVAHFSTRNYVCPHKTNK